MKLHWIHFVNIAKFKDVRIDFDDRKLIAVTGTNGIGKTHLIQGLSMLLWGKKARGKKTYSLYDTLSWGESECQIEGEFTHRGQRWYAKRQGKSVKNGKGKAKNSGSAELYKMVDGVQDEKPFAGPSTTDFDEKVAGLFGTLDVFLACVVAAQKGAGDLLEADRGERYEVFAEMTGANGLMAIGEAAKERQKLVWEQLTACSGSASLLRAQAGDVDKLAGELELGRRTLAELDLSLEGAKGLLETNTARLAELNAQTKNYTEAAVKLTTLLAEQSRLRLIVQELRRKLNEAAQAKGDIPTLQRQVAELKAAQAELELLREADKTWSLLDQEISQKSKQLLSELDAIAADETLLTEQAAHAENLDKVLAVHAVNKTAFEAAQAAEQVRFNNYQIINAEANALFAEIDNLTEQAALAADVPAPDGLCRSCKLVSAALTARDRLPGVIAKKDEAVARWQTVAFPIQLPHWDRVAHDQAQWQRNQLGNPAAGLAALTPRKRSAKEKQYELDDLAEKLRALAYDPEKIRAAELIAKAYAEAPQRLAVSETVSVNLLGLESQHQQEETREALVTAEIEQLRKQFGHDAEPPATLANELASLKQEMRDNEASTKQMEADRTSLLVRLGSTQAGLTKGREQILQAERFEAQKAYWNAKWDRLGVLRHVFSKTGVLPIIIRKIAPEIESLADETLESVWASLGRLRIRTESDSGREIIDIFVETGDELHPVELYSGGEEHILRLVLRLAIGRWRAMRSGQSYDLLGFDETFDTLAPENAGKVIMLLQGMLEFVSQVLVISHTDDTVLEIPDKLQLEQVGGDVIATWRN